MDGEVHVNCRRPCETATKDLQFFSWAPPEGPVVLAMAIGPLTSHSEATNQETRP